MANSVGVGVVDGGLRAPAVSADADGYVTKMNWF